MMSSKLILALATAASLTGMASTASAREWAAHHPRQTEVLARAHNQIHRVGMDRREGEITLQEAHALKAEDRAVIKEVHTDAKANGGYITKAEQHEMNAKLNAQSRVIGR